MALKYVSIVLKIVQIVVLLGATGVVGYFMKEIRDDDNTTDIDPYDRGYYGRHEFFLYTASVGVVIAVLSLVGSFTGLLEKQGGTLAMIFVYALWAFQLVISAALLTKILTSLQKELDIGEGNKMSTCDFFDKADKAYQCSELEGGVACGFIAAIVFAVDTIIYVISAKQSPQ